MRARRLLGTVVARGEEERGAGKGTGAARVRSPGSLREAEQYDCSCLIQTEYVTIFIKEQSK